MTVSAPTEFPQWATNPDGSNSDIVNSTSGETNVVEPDASKKLIGWDYQEAPPREHMNWLHRLYDQWIRWFNQELLLLLPASGTVSASIYGSTQTITINWQSIGKMVTLSIPSFTVAANTRSGNTILMLTTANNTPGVPFNNAAGIMGFVDNGAFSVIAMCKKTEGKSDFECRRRCQCRHRQ